MATTEQVRDRIRLLVRELREEFSGLASEGECLLATWENEAVALSDLLAQEWIEQQAQSQAVPSGSCCCETCGSPGERKPDRRRRLQSRRGVVDIAEPEYFCPTCRKSFFPSDPRARRGTRLPTDAGVAS